MKTKRASSGQTLVEFALVFPLILLIVVVFIDLGRIVYYHSALSNAVREGARYAIVHQYTVDSVRQSDVQQVVVKYGVGLPAFTKFSVYCGQAVTDPSLEDHSAPCSNYVTVYAKMQVDPMVPFMAQIIGSGNKFDVTAVSTMLMTPYGSYSN